MAITLAQGASANASEITINPREVRGALNKTQNLIAEVLDKEPKELKAFINLRKNIMKEVRNDDLSQAELDRFNNKLDNWVDRASRNADDYEAKVFVSQIAATVSPLQDYLALSVDA